MRTNKVHTQTTKTNCITLILLNGIRFFKDELNILHIYIEQMQYVTFALNGRIIFWRVDTDQKRTEFGE